MTLDLDQLSEIVRRGESEHLEFKRTTALLKAAVCTVCAMLNGGGGRVAIGVADNGRILGQHTSTGTYESLASELRKIEPAVVPEISSVSLADGKEAIVLTVGPGADAPYTVEGRPYERRGPTTSVMPHATYARRLIEREHAIQRWENRIAEGVRAEDLDLDELNRTVDDAVRAGRLDASASRDPYAVLRSLNLLHGDSLLNAAVVLYGRAHHLQINYPQCSIRVARFLGTDRLADFADNRQYWGHAFSLLRRAERFLLDHVPIAGRVIAGKMQREDRPLYPPRATREALANAICHRDYSISGGAVSIAMYADRLEITNPGQLHFGLTVEKLFEPHESRPWNPLIAQVFYRAGVIESWGTGTLNMLRWCQEDGLPRPEYDVQPHAVRVNFFPSARVAWPKQDRTPGWETGDELMDQLVGQLVGRQVTPQVAQQVLSFCVQPRKAVEIQELIGLRDRGAFRQTYLRPLIAVGLMRVTVPNAPRSPQQRYITTEEGKRWLDKRNAGSNRGA